MEIILYSNFSKRKNSTKIPSGTGTTADVLMKHECSVENPVFLIETVDLSFNYCKWNDAYYFIDDIILNRNNIYELRCSMDVLATHKTQIGGYNTFIERSASDYDLTINDIYISSRQKIIDSRSQSKSPGIFSSSGCYIFPCMNRYGLQIFATDDLTKFAPMFYPSTYGVADFSQWLAAGIASIGDYAQYFGKVLWIPYDLSTIVSPNKTRYISVGTLSWDLGENNEIYILDPDMIVSSLGVLTFSKFTAYYGDFRDSSPLWTKYTLFIPGTGLVQLDPLMVNDPGATMTLYIYFCPATGAITSEIRNITTGGTYSIVGHWNGNLGADVPYGIASNDVSRILTPVSQGIAGAVGNAMVENYVGAIASGVGGLMNSVQTAMTPQATMMGGSGSLGEVKHNHDYILSRTVYDTAGIPVGNIGRPLYQNRTISTLSGFVKCGGASLDVSCFGHEKDAINSFLNSGFYYE